MALYSKANILSLIRDEINEPVARIFTDTQLEHFVDQGAQATSSLALCEKVTEEEALTTNKMIYPLTTYEFVAVESVTYHINASTYIEYGVQRVHPAVFGANIGYAAGTPKFWTTFRNTSSQMQVYIWPRPSNAAYTMRVRGYATVADFGAGASETLDVAMQFVPFYYAMSMVYARLGKHQLSAIHMQQFIAECNQWRYDHEGAIARVDSYDVGKIPDTTVIPQ